MNTLTLASIYESQGYKKEALKIYWEILEKDPQNRGALKGIDRLCKVRKRFKNRYPKTTKFFVKMRTKSEFEIFEKWLLS